MKNNVVIMVFILCGIWMNGCAILFPEDIYIRKKQEKVEKYLNEHYPNMELDKKQGVLDYERVYDGFTKRDVEIIKRKPDRIEETNRYGADEVWIYKEWDAQSEYFFKNGELVKQITIFWQ